MNGLLSQLSAVAGCALPLFLHPRAPSLTSATRHRKWRHCTTHTTPHYTTPHYNSLHYITLHYRQHHTTPHHTSPHTTPHHTTPHYTILHHTTPHLTSPHTTPHLTSPHTTPQLPYSTRLPLETKRLLMPYSCHVCNMKNTALAD